jgi:molybdenum cofactor synthesis domain-containing protein
MEQNLNLLAEQVGISPWEIRYRNAIRPGQILPNGQTILCEATGIAPGLVVHEEADTRITPDSGTSTASRQTVVTGEATRVAAEKLEQDLDGENPCRIREERVLWRISPQTTNTRRRTTKMKLMKTTDAVGQILCHDITQIIKGVTKDAVFRKGHIITEADIPVLLSVGKDHVYIWENDETMLHENEAAQILYELCKNEHMRPTPVKEGKIELVAECDGLFKIDREKLNQINSLGEMMIASRHGDFPVKKGDKLAGTRIIPLVIEKEKMDAAKAVGGQEPIFALKPFLKKKVGIVTTGNEVYYGRIQDTFTPVIREKLSEYDAEILGHEISNDETERIAAAIRRLLEAGADLIICTGGMSVDPDDKTPGAIGSVASSVVAYGAPVLPGAMFLLAYYGADIPILGLPGCVMYARRTIFDLVLPRIMAGERLEKKDLDRLGEGGLCLSCPVCTFPNCGFGK